MFCVFFSFLAILLRRVFSELYDASEILEGDVQQLHNSLTCRTIPAATSMRNGSEILVTDLSATEAAASRDALCRAVYGRLFAWIVNRTNEAIKVLNIHSIQSSMWIISEVPFLDLPKVVFNMG